MINNNNKKMEQKTLVAKINFLAKTLKGQGHYGNKGDNQDGFFSHANQDASFIAVIDGHSEHGDSVKDYIIKSLPELIDKYDFAQKSKIHINLTNLFEKLQSGLLEFFQTDLKIKDPFAQYEFNGFVTPVKSGGACITFILIPNDKSNTMHIAQLGDTSCILYNKDTNTVETLTSDHSPTNIVEAQRILLEETCPPNGKRSLDFSHTGKPIWEKIDNKLYLNLVNEACEGFSTYDDQKGGYIGFEYSESQPRGFSVVGRLAITRALGDFQKQIAGCIAVPEITVHTFENSNWRLLLASDGVTDTLGKGQLLSMLQEHSDQDKLATALIDNAIETNFGDDTTIVVIDPK